MSAGIRSISGSFSGAAGAPPPIPERQTPGVGSIARHGSLSGASIDNVESSPSLSSVGRRDSQASQSSQSSKAQPSPARPQQQSSVVDEAEDTMKNLRKTFAGIFGDM
jgi:synapsin